MCKAGQWQGRPIAMIAARGRTSRDAELQLTTRVGEPLTDMSQFPGDKAGPWRAELDEFKLIRARSHSDGCRHHAASAVHR
jgi:hypothetical protein